MEPPFILLESQAWVPSFFPVTSTHIDPNRTSKMYSKIGPLSSIHSWLAASSKPPSPLAQMSTTSFCAHSCSHGCLSTQKHKWSSATRNRIILTPLLLHRLLIPPGIKPSLFPMASVGHQNPDSSIPCPIMFPTSSFSGQMGVDITLFLLAIYTSCPSLWKAVLPDPGMSSSWSPLHVTSQRGCPESPIPKEEDSVPGLYPWPALFLPWLLLIKLLVPHHSPACRSHGGRNPACPAHNCTPDRVGPGT